jgi:SM-20-related protein
VTRAGARVEASRVSDAALAHALAAQGFAVAPEFLAGGEVAALRAEALRRRRAGEFRAGRIGREAGARRDPALRGDEICWLDAAAASAPERALLARFEALRLALNRELFLGVIGLEAHYACYGAGAGYARHLDRFRDDDARAISLVLYLNDAWRDEQGGELRLFANEAAREPALVVAPRGGTLVAMRSDTIAHEVLPARRERWSVAAWLRRRSRADAMR